MLQRELSAQDASKPRLTDFQRGFALFQKQGIAERAKKMADAEPIPPPPEDEEIPPPPPMDEEIPPPPPMEEEIPSPPPMEEESVEEPPPPPPQDDSIPPAPPDDGDTQPHPAPSMSNAEQPSGRASGNVSRFIESMNNLNAEIKATTKENGFEWKKIGHPSIDLEDQPYEKKAGIKLRRREVNASSDPTYRAQGLIHAAAKTYIEQVSTWSVVEKSAKRGPEFSRQIAQLAIEAGRDFDTYKETVRQQGTPKPVREHIPSKSASKHRLLSRWFPSLFPGKIQQSMKWYTPHPTTEAAVDKTLSKSSTALRNFVLSRDFDATTLSRKELIDLKSALQTMGIDTGSSPLAEKLSDSIGLDSSVNSVLLHLTVDPAAAPFETNAALAEDLPKVIERAGPKGSINQAAAIRESTKKQLARMTDAEVANVLRGLQAASRETTFGKAGSRTAAQTAMFTIAEEVKKAQEANDIRAFHNLSDADQKLSFLLKADQSHPLRAAFKAHVQRTFKDENLNFLEAVEEYRQGAQTIEKSRAFIALRIQVGAPEQINISDPIRSRVMTTFDELASKKELTPDDQSRLASLFDESAAVARNLSQTNDIPTFLKSDELGELHKLPALPT